MNQPEEMNQKNATSFESRVGVHFDGPIVAGIVITIYQRLTFWYKYCNRSTN
jgi:hypothetical protein